MNYHALTRRELQALCKEHKIPANKTNVFMAEALTTLLGVSPTSQLFHPVWFSYCLLILL